MNTTKPSDPKQIFGIATAPTKRPDKDTFHEFSREEVRRALQIQRPPTPTELATIAGVMRTESARSRAADAIRLWLAHANQIDCLRNYVTEGGIKV
jgi:hypothetical protein